MQGRQAGRQGKGGVLEARHKRWSAQVWLSMAGIGIRGCLSIEDRK